MTDERTDPDADRRSDATDASHQAPSERPSVTDPATLARHAAYWRENIRLVAMLVAVWFLVSYGAGILFAETLNAVRLPGTGFPLGFWFAQQGSIYVFVALIFVYVWRMNVLDRRYEVDEGEAQ